MDSLTLRIILLALGVFFIVGIYLWDKRNHVDARLFNRRKSRKKRHASRDRQKGQAGFGNDPNRIGKTVILRFKKLRGIRGIGIHGSIKPLF